MSLNPDASDDDLAAVVRDAIASAQSQVYTALPGAVQSYDAASQTCAVILQVRSPLTGEFPVLPRVPVAHLRAGGLHVTLPIASGDTGLVLFSSLDMSRWRGTGRVSESPDQRRNSLTSAVFVPALYSAPRALPAPDSSAVCIGADGGTFHSAALANLVASELTRIVTATLAGLGAITPAPIGAAAVAAFNGSYNPVGPPPSELTIGASNLKAT